LRVNVQAPDFSWCSHSKQWEVLVSILVREMLVPLEWRGYAKCPGCGSAKMQKIL